ncbi:MAG TPA: PGPGW domain-containing protein [Myxococcota bacterium]|jgi:tellurite resistance protein TerC
MVREAIRLTYRTARRIAIGVVGVSVVIVGVAMIVLPGPAFIVIPSGLAILSLEFAFARRWLHSMKNGSQSAVNRLRGLRGPARPAHPAPRG